MLLALFGHFDQRVPPIAWRTRAKNKRIDREPCPYLIPIENLGRERASPLPVVFLLSRNSRYISFESNVFIHTTLSRSYASLSSIKQNFSRV